MTNTFLTFVFSFTAFESVGFSVTIGIKLVEMTICSRQRYSCIPLESCRAASLIASAGTWIPSPVSPAPSLKSWPCRKFS